MSRVYKLQDTGDFRAGTDRVGRQLLMGLQERQVVSVFFDSAGHYIGIESRAPSTRLLPDFSNRASFRRGVGSLMKRWQREIGFQPGTIQVERFQVERRPIFIKDTPDDFGVRHVRQKSRGRTPFFGRDFLAYVGRSR